MSPSSIDKPLLDLVTADLVRDEGEVLHAYQDSEGWWTIGVGRLIDSRKGGGISRLESRLLLANDIARFVVDLDRELPWWRTLSINRQRVIINMAFNLGVGSRNPGRGLLGFRNTLAAVERGDYKAAAAGMLASKWATQVGDRAVRLAKLMTDG